MSGLPPPSVAATHAGYPLARRTSAAYTLHGDTIAEPYDYLENPNHADTKAFVAGQNAYFESYMAGAQDTQAKIEASITQTQNYARTGPPMQHGDYIYYDYNTGLQNQSVLMRRPVSAAAEATAAEVFLDPNALSTDGTSALSFTSWSADSAFMAYSVSDKGSDWQHIHVRDAAAVADLSERIEWAKFTNIAWWGRSGFFYTRFPALAADTDKGAETTCAEASYVCFHRLGTPQWADVTVVPSDPAHPKWGYGVAVSDDERFLVIAVREGCEPHNQVWLAALPSSAAELIEGAAASCRPLPVRKVIAEFTALYRFLGNDGDVFYFLTTHRAPLRRVIALRVGNSEVVAETEVVPERSAVINHIAMARHTLFLVYLEDVKDTLYTVALPANVGDGEAATAAAAAVKVELPIGSLLELRAKRHTSYVSFKIAAFLLPGRVYVTDAADPVGALSVFTNDAVPGFDPDQFTTEQHFYTAATDGTRVPMFVTYKSRDGRRPTADSPVLLFGYGGFNIAMTPVFSPFRLTFLQNLNGVLAIPNIRGGSEYGQRWHDAGRRANKQNCFTDFIAAAAYLHASKIGSPATTAAMGRSNGGLLMGAIANMAPATFRCIVCQVGVLDMYKFHKFTIGHAWVSDYGNPDNADDYAVVRAYSPLHNVRAGVTYPAILVVTGDHDDRVVPLHSLKYVATLQHANPTSGGPFLARIDASGGHGMGKPVGKLIREEADIYTFIAKELGLIWAAS